MSLMRVYPCITLLLIVGQVLLPTSEANLQPPLNQRQDVGSVNNENVSFSKVDHQNSEDDIPSDTTHLLDKTEREMVGIIKSLIQNQNSKSSYTNEDKLLRNRRKLLSNHKNKKDNENMFQSTSEQYVQDSSQNISFLRVNESSHPTLSKHAVDKPSIGSSKRVQSSNRYTMTRYPMATRSSSVRSTPVSEISNDSNNNETAIRSNTNNNETAMKSNTNNKGAPLKINTNRTNVTSETYNENITSSPRNILSTTTKGQSKNNSNNKSTRITTTIASTFNDASMDIELTVDPEIINTTNNQNFYRDSLQDVEEDSDNITKQAEETKVNEDSLHIDIGYDRKNTSKNYSTNISIELDDSLHESKDSLFNNSSEDDSLTNYKHERLSNETESNASSKCKTCGKTGITEEDIKKMHLKMFEYLLAEKLRINIDDLQIEGMQSDGSVRDPSPKLPPSILEEIIKDNAEEIEKDQFYAKDQEIIIAGDHIRSNCTKTHNMGCYSFNLKDKIKSEVSDVYLWFYKAKYNNDANGQNISVSQLEILEKSGKLALKGAIATETTFTKEGWIRLNVTNALLKWIEVKTNIQILAIRCSTCEPQSPKSIPEEMQDYKPLLVVKYTMKSQVIRKKRSELCDPRYECCKRHLTFNLLEISVIDVIQPSSLSLGYCYGECNGIHQYTNHTALRQRYRNSLERNHSLVPQLIPCCVPVKLLPVSFTIWENNVMVTKHVPYVRVDKCGCM